MQMHSEPSPADDNANAGPGLETIPGCGCITCVDSRPTPLEFGIPNSRTYMVICEVCGNKRCPHATWHGYACTGSNAIGQRGSVYGGLALAEMGGEVTTGGGP